MKNDLSEVMPAKTKTVPVKEVNGGIKNLSEVCPTGPQFKNESGKRDSKKVALRD
jgi:hypothetical protein